MFCIDPALEFSSNFYVTQYSSHFIFLPLPLPFGVGGLILSDLFACFFFLPLLIYRKPAKVDFSLMALTGFCRSSVQEVLYFLSFSIFNMDFF